MSQNIIAKQPCRFARPQDKERLPVFLHVVLRSECSYGTKKVKLTLSCHCTSVVFREIPDRKNILARKNSFYSPERQKLPITAKNIILKLSYSKSRMI